MQNQHKDHMAGHLCVRKRHSLFWTEKPPGDGCDLCEGMCWIRRVPCARLSVGSSTVPFPPCISSSFERVAAEGPPWWPSSSTCTPLWGGGAREKISCMLNSFGGGPTKINILEKSDICRKWLTFIDIPCHRHRCDNCFHHRVGKMCLYRGTLVCCTDKIIGFSHFRQDYVPVYSHATYY